MKIHSIESRYVETIPRELEEGVLYISKKYEIAVHLCCCGCGVHTVTPTHEPWWKLTEDENGVTLHPSIGNQKFPCRSHYWIRGNKVVWC